MDHIDKIITDEGIDLYRQDYNIDPLNYWRTADTPERQGITENKVAFARQAYNDSVMDYNTLRESFPNNFFAGWFAFRAAELLEIEDESKRETPKVSF